MVRDRYRAEFDKLSLDDLRKRISVGLYNGEKHDQAIIYLDEKDHGEAREFNRETLSLMRLQTDVARSANRAAWIAAITAIIAAAIATYSIPSFQTWLWRLFSS
ncbi:MAG: hypothetical protein OJI67_18530 [Prosthecobacter sp.]|nr:hypothetical protein [Prosthecobacter sp.]